MRLSVRRKVDLPQPDGPMNAVTLSMSTSIDTWLSACLAPRFADLRGQRMARAWRRAGEYRDSDGSAEGPSVHQPRTQPHPPPAAAPNGKAYVRERVVQYG